MKSKIYLVLRLTFWLIVVLAFLLLLVIPSITRWLITSANMPYIDVDLLGTIGTIQAYLARGLALLWLFFFGSSLASFLNVVAWRVPRGRGINGASHCPNCNSKLSFFDKIPITGWLRNEGKCRSCRIPISPRYLWVEVALGSIFLLVAIVQLFFGGVNLPIRQIEQLTGIEYMIIDPKWELIQLTLFHLLLICLLFTFALIRSERLKIPVPVFASGIVFGFALPLIWPAMLLVSWQIGLDELVTLPRFSLDQILTLSIGLLSGLGFGAILQWALGFKNNEPPVFDSVIVSLDSSGSSEQNLNSAALQDHQDAELDCSNSTESESSELESNESTNLDEVNSEESNLVGANLDGPSLKPTELETTNSNPFLAPLPDGNAPFSNLEVKNESPPSQQKSETPVIQERSVFECIAGVGLIGLFLGWQSALSISLILCMIFLVKRPSIFFNASTWMLLATLLHLLCWRLSTAIKYWPSLTASSVTMLAFFGALIVLAKCIQTRIENPSSNLGTNNIQ